MGTRPLKILLVCRAFPAHRPGGMEQHVHDLAEGLATAGHEAHLLTTPLPPSVPLSEYPRHISVTTIGGRCGRYDLRFFRQAVTAARRIHEEHGLDIIHTQGLALFPFALKGDIGVPVVGTIHGTHWNETPLDRRHPDRRRLGHTLLNLWHYKHRFVTWPLWRLLLARRPHLIVDSDFTRRELLAESRRLAPRVVPLGFDLHPYDFLTRANAVDARRRLMPTVEPEGPLLFAVGRHERVKGFETLIHAANHLPADARFTLVIGGAGPDTSRLKAMAAQSPHARRILLPGRIPVELLPMWFGAADVFLNADEGQPAFGLVNAQALVCGTPVLASKVGAHPEIVRDGDGAILPPGNRRAWQKAITNALGRLPEQDETRQRRRERAHTRFDRETMIAKLEKCYREVIAAQP